MARQFVSPFVIENGNLLEPELRREVWGNGSTEGETETSADCESHECPNCGRAKRGWRRLQAGKTCVKCEKET